MSRGRYTAMHHPFTMPMEEDIKYLDSDPGRVRAKAYDIVLNGTELGAAAFVSIRIISRKRCLKFSDFQRKRLTSALASF